MNNEKYSEMEEDIEKQIKELKNDLLDHSNFLINKTWSNMNHAYRWEEENECQK